jgi:UDP-N-acetylmuramate dehydrogenase
MMRMRALEGALQKARVGEIRLEERLANYTWLGVGGPCRALVRPPDLASLERLIRLLGEMEMPYLAIGGGTNLLVSDEGFGGVVISTEALQQWEETCPTVLRTGAGVATSRAVRWAASRNLSGLEGLAGVPGTIGGASVMNAGGAWGDISNALQQVTVVTSPPEVHVVTVEAEALKLAYRSSSLPPGSVIGQVDLAFTPVTEPGEVEARTAEVMEQRRNTQPKGVRSAGSTFRNPPGDRAGRLIDACGLKGLKEGDARVSEVHANFTLNTGHATATEVRTLIERVREEVRTRTGISLELEVVTLGFRGDPPPRSVWSPPVKGLWKTGRTAVS